MTDGEFGALLKEALYEVHDPEVGLNIIDMGLVYEVAFSAESGVAEILMTLTTPTCPAGEMIVEGVRRRLELIEGVKEVNVELTFEPRWSPSAISDAGRAQLGW